MSKELISKKTRNLLLNSETIKKDTFTKLYNHLQTNDVITFDDVKKYPYLNNLPTYLDDLVSATRSEWKPSDSQPIQDLGTSYKELKIECDLCGYKYLKLKNQIVNQLNGKSMSIGSECVKEFGEVIRGLIDKVKRDTQRAERRMLLEKHIPNIRKFVESTNFINSFDMIIPLYFEKNLSGVTLEIKKHYEEFINGKTNKLDIIKSKWTQKNSIMLEIENFVNENKRKKFAASFKVKDWVLENNDYSLIRQIREDNGFIEWRTIYKIYEDSFMKNVLHELNKYLINENILIENINVSNRTVKLKFSKNNKYLYGIITYRELLLNIGGLLYGDPLHDEAKFKEILDIAEIKSSESVNTLLSFILEMIRNKSFIRSYQSGDNLFLMNQEKYIQVSISKLVNENKHYYFENFTTDFLVDWIYSHKTKVMSSKEFENYKQVKKLAAELEIKVNN